MMIRLANSTCLAIWFRVEILTYEWTAMYPTRPVSTLIDTDPLLGNLTGDLLSLHTYQTKSPNAWISSPSFKLDPAATTPLGSPSELINVLISTQDRV